MISHCEYGVCESMTRLYEENVIAQNYRPSIATTTSCMNEDAIEGKGSMYHNLHNAAILTLITSFMQYAGTT